MTKTVQDDLAEAQAWAIATLDAAIEDALLAWGSGAKPSPQQKGADTKARISGIDEAVSAIQGMTEEQQMVTDVAAEMPFESLTQAQIAALMASYPREVVRKAMALRMRTLGATPTGG